jgi:uncharacterized protein YraI
MPSDSVPHPLQASTGAEEIPEPPSLPELAASATHLPAPPRSSSGASIVAEGWAALLNNRFILAALGVVALLLLTTVILVAIGHGGSDDLPSANLGAPAGEKTAVRPVGSFVGTTVTAVGYRNGPGPTYSILGTIPRGATVAIVGRNEDESWLQVRYPPNSTLKGWVDAKLLEVSGDLTKLVVAGPGPVASADGVLPTAQDQPFATETVESEPTLSYRPTRTPTFRPTRTPYRPPTATSTVPEPPTATPPPVDSTPAQT